MIHIPKKILEKLKLQSMEESKKIAAEVEESRAIENTKRFKKSMEIMDKVGKEIGEMREWEPYCPDANTYSPFGIDILSCNKQQLLQLLIHAYGTAKHLKDKLDGKK